MDGPVLSFGQDKEECFLNFFINDKVKLYQEANEPVICIGPTALTNHPDKHPDKHQAKNLDISYRRLSASNRYRFWGSQERSKRHETTLYISMICYIQDLPMSGRLHHRL
jgi:hypothetical protein